MSNEIITSVEFKNLRLPYIPELADLGIDNIGWKVLVDAIFPNATTAESIIMAAVYCKRRNLDIFKRPINIVPMYSSAAKGMIDTVWPAISELRTTASRSGVYAGRDETKFGRELNETLGGKEVNFPEWAQITVYRIVGGQRCPFPGPRVYWLESYGRAKRDSEAPNEMWAKRPHGQLDKCAEAAALRGAFPEEIGGDYAAEEMDGQRLLGEAARDITPKLEPPTPPPAPEPLPPEPYEPLPDPASQGAIDTPPAPSAAKVALFGSIVEIYRAAALAAKDSDELDNCWNTHIAPIQLPGDLYETCCGIDDKRRGELE